MPGRDPVHGEGREPAPAEDPEERERARGALPVTPDDGEEDDADEDPAQAAHDRPADGRRLRPDVVEHFRLGVHRPG